MTTIDKLTFLIINRFIKDTLSSEDFTLLFEETPQLKKHLCEQYVEMPVLDNGEQRLLLVPAINLLMKVINNKDITNSLFIQLKDYLQPFKEVFYVHNQNKTLVHGFDLFNITKKSVDDVRTHQSLNIVNMNQFFICCNQSLKTNSFMLQSFHFNNHVKFDIDYELLFFSQSEKEIVQSKTLSFNSVLNLHINLEGNLDVQLQNINEVGAWITSKYFDLIEHKIKNNQKNFLWCEEKLTTLLASDNNNFSQEIVKKILIDSIAEGVSMTRPLISLLYVKNKKLCNEFIHYLNEKNVYIYDGEEQMPVLPKNELTLNLENLEKMIKDYANSDNEVINACQKFIDIAPFFTSEKALTYFSIEIESKHNIDSIFNKFVPNVVDSYFNLPVLVRNDTSRSFKSLTLEQLNTVFEKLQKIEYDVLESEMRKMKTFGLFLDRKFSGPK